MTQLKTLLIVLILATISACSDVRYYMQSIQGQWEISSNKIPIDDYLNDTVSPDHTVDRQLKQRLKLVRTLRRFAIDKLQLPETGSFTDYVDLKRGYVLKSLFAAAEFSTQLHHWCYPVIGCASYRGYFDQSMLAEDEKQLQQQGFDTYIADVPAYSTLGWFDDPILNTVINWPDYQLAGLIFHELAHQQLYVKGDTTFNESFASAVAQAGVILWLQARHDTETLRQYAARQTQNNQAFALIKTLQDHLNRLYQQKLSDTEKRQAKQQLIDQARQNYRKLKANTESFSRYDNWFASRLNNAKLGSVNAYAHYKTAFLAILSASNNDFDLFYQRVTTISTLNKQQRSQCLDSWSQQQPNSTALPDECR